MCSHLQQLSIPCHVHLIPQVIALWRLLYDERPIRFSSDDEEQVWRCFNRRCGMARMEFKLVGGYRHSMTTIVISLYLLYTGIDECACLVAVAEVCKMACLPC